MDYLLTDILQSLPNDGKLIVSRIKALNQRVIPNLVGLIRVEDYRSDRKIRLHIADVRNIGQVFLSS